MNHTNFLVVLVTIVLGAGCASEPDTGSWSETPLSDHQAALKEHTPEAISVLAWLNGLDATFDVLDNAVGLYSNTARNIVAHVRGPDGALGTRDDNPLDTIAELDAISRVGPRAMARILDYVEAIGGIRVEDVEGHTLTQAQVDRILEIVNHFSRDALDFEIGLDKRAANNLVASRPFEAMDQIAEVSYVGPAAILQLREYADRRRPGAEDIVVEGVVFTPPQAAEVVMLANLATRAQLDEEARLDARAALHIIAARDIGSVSELGQVKYVGKSALRKLRDYLPGWTPVPVDDAAAPDLGGADDAAAPDLGRPIDAAPPPTFEETIARILRARGVSQMTADFDEAETRTQAEEFGEQVTFEAALNAALRSYLEDGSEPDSPLALLEFSDGPPCEAGTPEDRVRCFLDHPTTTVALVGARGFPAEQGESIVENWVITLDIPRLSDHLHWAIVDRTGVTPAYNYGFN